jgi:hypothetical protein
MSLILSGTNGLSDVDGTAATPAIRGTDANTGIFFPAADTIAFAEGGVEAMRIDSSANVGIGTSSPGYKLDVNGVINGNNSIISRRASGSQPEFVLTQTGVASWAIYNPPSSTSLRFNNGNDLMTLDSSGNLGLGVTPTNAYGKLQAVASSTVLPTGDSNVPAGYSYAQFSGSSGAVSDWLLLRGPYGTAGHKTGILLQDTFYDNNAYGGRYIQATGGALTFGQMLNGTIYSSNGTLTEHARIDTSGNLLVGTTSNATGAKIVGAGGVGITNPARPFATVECGNGASGTFTTITISFTVSNAPASVILEVLMTGFSGVYLDHVAARYGGQPAVVMRNNASSGTTVASLAVDGTALIYTLTITTSVTHPVVKVKATVGGLANGTSLPTITLA